MKTTKTVVTILMLIAATSLVSAAGRGRRGGARHNNSATQPSSRDNHTSRQSSSDQSNHSWTDHSRSASQTERPATPTARSSRANRGGSSQGGVSSHGWGPGSARQNYRSTYTPSPSAGREASRKPSYTGGNTGHSNSFGWWNRSQRKPVAETYTPSQPASGEHRSLFGRWLSGQKAPAETYTSGPSRQQSDHQGDVGGSPRYRSRNNTPDRNYGAGADHGRRPSAGTGHDWPGVSGDHQASHLIDGNHHWPQQGYTPRRPSVDRSAWHGGYGRWDGHDRRDWGRPEPAYGSIYFHPNPWRYRDWRAHYHISYEIFWPCPAPFLGYVYAPVTPSLLGAVIIGSDNTFLGVISRDTYDPDSLANPNSYFGDPRSPDSIWNPDGRWGADNSDNSPWNPYATHPPAVYLNNVFQGYLTVNPDLHPRLDPNWLVSYLGLQS